MYPVDVSSKVIDFRSLCRAGVIFNWYCVSLWTRDDAGQKENRKNNAFVELLPLEIEIPWISSKKAFVLRTGCWLMPHFARKQVWYFQKCFGIYEGARTSKKVFITVQKTYSPSLEGLVVETRFLRNWEIWFEKVVFKCKTVTSGWLIKDKTRW